MFHHETWDSSLRKLRSSHRIQVNSVYLGGVQWNWGSGNHPWQDESKNTCLLHNPSLQSHFSKHCLVKSTQYRICLNKCPGFSFELLSQPSVAANVDLACKFFPGYKKQVCCANSYYSLCFICVVCIIFAIW